MQRADHSSRGVLLSVIVKPRQYGGPGLLLAVAPWVGGGGGESIYFRIAF